MQKLPAAEHADAFGLYLIVLRYSAGGHVLKRRKDAGWMIKSDERLMGRFQKLRRVQIIVGKPGKVSPPAHAQERIHILEFPEVL